MTQGGGAGRSTAIVLFTDLVGSTELRSRLGEQAAEELRRKHDGLVAGAIEANRGRVVKNLGDGVMATFAGASDAVAAGVAIQQAIDRHNRSGPGPLGVRMGISAGDVTVEEDDCFGTPVIEATRLCAAAEGGQVLASDLVRGLAGAGSGNGFRPLGTLDLEGLPTVVVACDVVWEPVTVSPVRLPALLIDMGRIFVRRETVLDRLRPLSQRRRRRESGGWPSSLESLESGNPAWRRLRHLEPVDRRESFDGNPRALLPVFAPSIKNPAEYGPNCLPTDLDSEALRESETVRSNASCVAAILGVGG